jgi:hypothetical protein
MRVVQPIAIVGTGCRLPGGVRSRDDLWGSKDRWRLPGIYHPDPAKLGRISTRWDGCLQHRQIPANLRFWIRNLQIPFSDLHLRVAQQFTAWAETPAHPPRAGVNAFEFGGTNEHVALAALPGVRRNGLSMDRKQGTVRPWISPFRNSPPNPSRRLCRINSGVSSRREGSVEARQAWNVYSCIWCQRDRGIIPGVTNRDLGRTWKTLAGKANSKTTRVRT